MISTAQYGLLILLFLFLLLHIVVLLKIIPYNIVWGGRLKSYSEMYRFEIFSILITIVFILVIWAKAGFGMSNIPGIIITLALWLMTCLFLINTVSNAISKNKIERLVFTPATLVMAAFSLILALSN
jgi:hypothetical protein